jgi:hypothetical protein
MNILDADGKRIGTLRPRLAFRLLEIARRCGVSPAAMAVLLILNDLAAGKFVTHEEGKQWLRRARIRSPKAHTYLAQIFQATA